MDAALRFQGRAGRIAYLIASLGVFFSQHLIIVLGASFSRGRLELPWWFWLNPFRAELFSQLGSSSTAHPQEMALGMLATGLVDVALVWLAFRRGQYARGGGWIATLAIVPVVQIGVVLWLTVAPRLASLAEDGRARTSREGARTTALSLLLGVGAIVATVALSTLLFHIYGYALFLVSPFLIAVAVGYLANYESRIGLKRTFGLVLCSFALGAAALVGFAFEGLICLLLAAPLALLMGAVGAEFGIALAGLRRPKRGTTLTSIAVIPLLLAGESMVPPHASFASVEWIDVQASRSAVWDALVHMGPIPDKPAAPFRWGLAYPVRGEIMGTGVGSIRKGVFSTGVAYERVTEWRPGRKLSFIVLSDPPAIKELSPYDDLDPPHRRGYFRTLDASFTLTPLANGKTRLALTTRHALDLEPALYWTPLAEWAIHANKQRVLAHFRQQAESFPRR